MFKSDAHTQYVKLKNKKKEKRREQQKQQII